MSHTPYQEHIESMLHTMQPRPTLCQPSTLNSAAMAMLFERFILKSILATLLDLFLYQCLFLHGKICCLLKAALLLISSTEDTNQVALLGLIILMITHPKFYFYIVQGYVSIKLLLHLFGILSFKCSLHGIFKWLAYC